MNFNSWVEAASYFNITPGALQNSNKRHHKYKDWEITKLSSQKKSIRIFKDSEILEFNSYNECDRYFNMWRGYTSELIHKKDDSKFLDKYSCNVFKKHRLRYKSIKHISFSLDSTDIETGNMSGDLRKFSIDFILINIITIAINKIIIEIIKTIKLNILFSIFYLLL